MTSTPASLPSPATRSSGWLDAILFAIALSALNVSYGLGGQMGVRSTTLLVWAMPSAAVALLLTGGFGRDWRAVILHPLSLVVGSGIIAMEAVYYLLLTYVTPTDGSLLVRIGVPVAMILGIFLRGRLPSLLSALGGIIIVATIFWYTPQMTTEVPLLALALATGCGAIMSTRSFASEFHPWNRAARTILEKMRITGLMLLVSSTIGLLLLFAISQAAGHGLIEPPRWLPTSAELLAPHAVALGLTVGVLVLTAMQYLGFATVVKLGTESFVATTALIPVATLGVQALAVALGILKPIPVDWRVAPAMVAVILGVALVITGQHRK